MTAITMPLSMSFNILAYLDRLRDAGMPEPQAKAQAEAMQTVLQSCDMDVRKISESTARETVNSMRAELREELATKGDIADVRGAVRETELRLQKEIEVVRKEIKEVELRLVTRIDSAKHEMIKWYIGMTIALVAVFYAMIR